MISEIERFFDESIQVYRAALSGIGSGMHQHVFNDAVGALTVLDDFPQITAQCLSQILDLGPRFRQKERYPQLLIPPAVQRSIPPKAQQNY